ncbi:MAG: fructose-bisphosphate aldolase, partial [Bacteroidota bacterium]
MSKHSIAELLGTDADNLLNHTCKTISKEQIHLPGPNMVDNVFVQSNRKTNVLRNLSSMFNTGRLAGTGFLS